MYLKISHLAEEVGRSPFAIQKPGVEEGRKIAAVVRHTQ